MNSKKSRIGICAYCGKQKELTRDHIPPKNLFPPPRPKNLITIPSCHNCNNSASKDDEYFRLMLIPRIDIFLNPDAQKLWEPIKRGLAKPEKIRFSKSYIKRIKKIPNSTLHGYDVNVNRICSVATRVIKGLFYNEFGLPIPDNYDIDVFCIDALKPNFLLRDLDTRKVMSALSHAQAYSIGGDIFNFRALNIEDSGNYNFTTVWLLSFFKQAHFIGFVMPKTLTNI